MGEVGVGGQLLVSHGCVSMLKIASIGVISPLSILNRSLGGRRRARRGHPGHEAADGDDPEVPRSRGPAPPHRAKCGIMTDYRVRV
jgi:hypothetical protein